MGCILRTLKVKTMHINSEQHYVNRSSTLTILHHNLSNKQLTSLTLIKDRLYVKRSQETLKHANQQEAVPHALSYLAEQMS